MGVTNQSVIEYASHMGRKPTVGGKAAEHSQFAREITAYLNRVREESNLSVRGVSAQTVGERSNSWWADIFNGSKILTTSDIDYIATELLGVTPYRFVDNARKFAEGLETPPARFYVRALDDDVHELTREQEQELRRSDVDLAAYRGRNEAETPHTE